MPDFWGRGVLTLLASSEMTVAFPITTLSTGMVSVLPSQVSGEICPRVISPNKPEILTNLLIEGYESVLCAFILRGR